MPPNPGFLGHSYIAPKIVAIADSCVSRQRPRARHAFAARRKAMVSPRRASLVVRLRNAAPRRIGKSCQPGTRPGALSAAEQRLNRSPPAVTPCRYPTLANTSNTHPITAFWTWETRDQARAAAGSVSGCVFRALPQTPNRLPHRPARGLRPHPLDVLRHVSLRLPLYGGDQGDPTWLPRSSNPMACQSPSGGVTGAAQPRQRLPSVGLQPARPP